MQEESRKYLCVPSPVVSHYQHGLFSACCKCLLANGASWDVQDAPKQVVLTRQRLAVCAMHHGSSCSIPLVHKHAAILWYPFCRALAHTLPPASSTFTSSTLPDATASCSNCRSPSASLLLLLVLAAAVQGLPCSSSLNSSGLPAAAA